MSLIHSEDPPLHCATDAIAVANSADSKRRWTLYARTDGLFAYIEETFICGPDFQINHWDATLTSGLFATAEEANADALIQLPWLQQLP